MSGRRAPSRPPSTTCGSPARSERQREPERRPATGRRLDRDRPAVGLHEAPRDRQPEPGAARVACPSRNGRRRAARAPGRSRARCRRRSGRATPVHDRPPIVTRPPAGVWRSPLATRFASTSRIRTGSTSRIGRSSGTSVVISTEAASAAGRNERATSAISRSGSVGSGWSGSMPASESEIVRRSSMSRSRTRVSSRIGARCAASGRVDAVDDRLEVAGDDRQRRAQLVADVGEQVAALLLVGLQAGGHGVEAAGELLDRREVGAGSCRPGRRSRRPRPGGSRRPSGRGRGRRRGCRGAGPRRSRWPPRRRSRPGAVRGSRAPTRSR